MEILIVVLLCLLILAVIIMGLLVLRSNSKRNDSLKSSDEFLNLVKQIKEPLNSQINNESIKLANQFNSLNKDIGELRSLSSSLSNLDKIFSNNKEKGNWGELKLESLLESIFPDRYLTQETINKGEKVDFALKIKSSEIPSKDILVPIDCKNYTEDYLAIVDIRNKSNFTEKELETAINKFKSEIINVVKDIKKKYIYPPKTTDFAIMYVPSEAIFIEISSMDGFIIECQKKHNVIISGPTSMTGLLFNLRYVYNNFGIDKGNLINNVDKLKKDIEKFEDALGKAETHITNATKQISFLREKYNDIKADMDKFEEYKED